MLYEFWGLIFGGAYTWRGLFSEFYGMFFVKSCDLKLIYYLKYKIHRRLKFHFGCPLTEA